jgi:hypothetical protein
MLGDYLHAFVLRELIEQCGVPGGVKRRNVLPLVRVRSQLFRGAAVIGGQVHLPGPHGGMPDRSAELTSRLHCTRHSWNLAKVDARDAEGSLRVRESVLNVDHEECGCRRVENREVGAHAFR